MIDARLALVAAAALGSGPIVFRRGFRHLRTCRLIQNTPTARIRSMPMGLVEINGKVMPRSTVVAPFSGQPCAYWEVDVSVRGRRRGSWAVVHRNQSGHPFYLEDETGLALVYPHGANCRVRFGTEEDCLGLNLPECYADYLKQHLFALNPLIRLSTLRFRERKLEEGERIYVLGTAAPRSREVVVHDGDLLAATGTEDLRATRLRSLDAEVDAVVRQGENEATFLISQASERDLVLGLRWKALGMICGGPALTLFGLGYWLAVMSAWRMPR